MVTTLTGQQRPATTHPGSIKRRAVCVFTITIPVIAMPDRAVRCVGFQQAIHQLQGIQNQGIVCTAQSQTNQLQKIDAHLFGRFQLKRIIPVLDGHVPTQSSRTGHHFDGRFSNVMRLDSMVLAQYAAMRNAPVFQTGIPVVGHQQGQGTFVFGQQLGTGHQCGNADGQRIRIHAGIFFPSVLRTGRAFSRQKSQCATYHIHNRHAPESLRFGQAHGKQNRKGNFVQLQTFPIMAATQPLILIPVAIRVLGRHEIAQHGARFLCATQCQQSLRALDQIARPNQMVAATLFTLITPGH